MPSLVGSEMCIRDRSPTRANDGSNCRNIRAAGGHIARGGLPDAAGFCHRRRNDVCRRLCFSVQGLVGNPGWIRTPTGLRHRGDRNCIHRIRSLVTGQRCIRRSLVGRGLGSRGSCRRRLVRTSCRNSRAYHPVRHAWTSVMTDNTPTPRVVPVSREIAARQNRSSTWLPSPHNSLDGTETTIWQKPQRENAYAMWAMCSPWHSLRAASGRITSQSSKRVPASPGYPRTQTNNLQVTCGAGR